MSCCGGKRKVSTNKTDVNIEMVSAMFVTDNVSHEVIYGDARLLGGRRIKYGKKTNGDVFNVAVADIKARPGRYLAPCGEPFDFDKNGVIIIPCKDKPVAVETVHGEDLTEIPGVGQATARKFAENGIYTKGDVAKLSKEELIKIGVPPLSRNKIEEWKLSRL